MPRPLLFLILIASAIRIVVASILELGNDEVYYYLYALDLQSNYFDHPPGVGVLIRIFTINLLLKHELFVRLGAIACAAVGTWLSYKLGSELRNERTGWYAAILYTTSIYASVIAGTFIVPDSPQIIFWLGSMIFMHKILKADKPGTGDWLWFAALTGVSILCKVHGIFLWFSLGLYILLFRRSLLTNPWLYFSASITLLIISPILVWNFQNEFITYTFHSARVNVEDSGIHFDYFFRTLGGQLAYCNPVNAILIVVGLWKIRQIPFLSADATRFVLVNGLPIILVVTFMALFNPIFPHWSGPGFLSLSFLAAGYLDYKSNDLSIRWPALVKLSMWTIGILLIVAMLTIKMYPGTIGSKEHHKLGEDDFTLDLYGWKAFSVDFGKWLEEEERAARIPAGLPLVSNKWFPAAHVDYYVAQPLSRPLIGVGWINDIHQYYWLNKNRPPLRKGEGAICIVPSNYYMILEESYYNNFNEIEMLKTFYSNRGGEPVRYFTVYWLKDYKENDEAHVSGPLNPR